MKRLRLSLLLIPLFATLNLSTQAREVVNLNREWRFFLQSATSSDLGPLTTLPHSWNSDAFGGTGGYFRGRGNYIREVNIPAKWDDRRLFIKCYGATSAATLMVNGRYVAQHRGGYTAFVFEITKYLHFGRPNTLWFSVDNSLQMDLPPTAGDQNIYGGLFRGVELVVTPNTAIAVDDYASDGLYIVQHSVTKGRAEGVVEVKVHSLNEESVTATLTITDSQQKEIKESSHRSRVQANRISTIQIPYAIDNPDLWEGIKSPSLYNFTVKLSNGSDFVLDSVTVSSGLRDIAISPNGEFMLNGEQYDVRGVVVHQDWAGVGSAISVFQVEEDVRLIRSMGANAVRVAGVAHHPEFYKLCDRHGILVWSDFPIVGQAYMTDRPFEESLSYRENAKEQAMEIVHQQFNHPSVVMWGLFSDLRIGGSDNPSSFISELNMTTKRIDPSRLTVATSSDDGEINFISDLIVWNHSFGWREGDPSDIKVWKGQLHRDWSKLHSGVSYSVGGSIHHQQDSLAKPPYLGNWHPERWHTYVHEEHFSYLMSDRKLWSVFVANMFDYGAVGRDWGEGRGVNDCGLVTFDRKFCKDAYFLYKANWSVDEPFVYISERRWRVRPRREQLIRVYTNCSDAELFVNNESRGVRSREQGGVIVWPGEELRSGVNTIEVRSDHHSDSIEITITGQ